LGIAGKLKLEMLFQVSNKHESIVTSIILVQL